jgi:hypothetical protein
MYLFIITKLVIQFYFYTHFKTYLETASQVSESYLHYVAVHRM